MSTHFSANQYDQAFDANRLQNWEVPKRFKERPSTLEGFTRIISNDRGHILEGIPRSSKSPWGEFVGTWDMQKPPLRTKTLKTKAMVENTKEKEIDILTTENEAARTPSPTKVQTPSPTKIRTPTPKQGKSPSPVMDARTPSPSKMRTPTPQCAPGRKSASPTQQSPRKSPLKQASPQGTPVNRKSPVLEAE